MLLEGPSRSDSSPGSPGRGGHLGCQVQAWVTWDVNVTRWIAVKLWDRADVSRWSPNPQHRRTHYMSLLNEVRTRRRLYEAWGKVQTAGRRSPSRATRNAIARFRNGVPRNIERIQESLRSGNFEFLPGTGVPVPREGKDPRPIVVQDVRDRIVQRSLLDVVMSVDAVTNYVDNGRSFGGIPERSVEEALSAISTQVNAGRAAYYIRSDIEGFFQAMPRQKALSDLRDLLPEDSLDGFLDRATVTELANHQELGHLLDFFPDATTGVPQGHALSALLGNVLLSPLDKAINSDGTIGIRYLDDFLILAGTKADAWAAFKRGRAVLASLGLRCYAPGKSEKAAEGSAQRRFEFLGCEVSRGFVRPSALNRRKLLERVDQHLRRSASRMSAGGFGGVDAYSDSVASTVLRVSRMVRGWGEQYSFCTYDKDAMDVTIDESIRNYLGLYGDRRARAETEEGRRMLGLWLLADVVDDREDDQAS